MSTNACHIIYLTLLVALPSCCPPVKIPKCHAFTGSSIFFGHSTHPCLDHIHSLVSPHLYFPFVIILLSVLQFIWWLIIIWMVPLGGNRKGAIPAGGISLISQSNNGLAAEALCSPLWKTGGLIPFQDLTKAAVLYIFAGEQISLNSMGLRSK